MAAVHAPFGLNYRHASNRGEAATSAARRQRHARAGRKNGNEAAPPPPPSPPSWQPSPPRWLSVRLGPDTGMKFSSKNARLREGREEGDGQNRYHADHCGNPRPSGQCPRWTSLHWIKALSTGREWRSGCCQLPPKPSIHRGGRRGRNDFSIHLLAFLPLQAAAAAGLREERTDPPAERS